MAGEAIKNSITGVILGAVAWVLAFVSGFFMMAVSRSDLGALACPALLLLADVWMFFQRPRNEFHIAFIMVVSFGLLLSSVCGYAVARYGIGG
jgi:hypothetical protein